MTHPNDIFQAIRNGDDSLVIEALDQNPALAAANNDQGLSLILWALYHRRKDLAEKISHYRPSLDAFEATALGRLETLQECIQSHPDQLHASSSDGFTLLHYACFFSHFSVAKWLISKGADIQAITPRPTELSPLHSAVTARATPIVQLLLAEGANPNIKQQGGYTPLMSASIHGDLEIMEALIRHGARIDTLSDDGKTAKAMAMEKNQQAAVDLLEHNSKSG